MNSREDAVRLQHMLDAVHQILKFTEGCSREDLDNNEMLALAVVRLIEIIGEAARNISLDVQLASPEIPWHQIKGIRNRLAQVYFDIDLDVIWGIVTNELGPLTQSIENLLSDT